MQETMLILFEELKEVLSKSDEDGFQKINIKGFRISGIKTLEFMREYSVPATKLLEISGEGVIKSMTFGVENDRDVVINVKIKADGITLMDKDISGQDILGFVMIQTGLYNSNRSGTYDVGYITINENIKFKNSFVIELITKHKKRYNEDPFFLGHIVYKTK